MQAPVVGEERVYQGPYRSHWGIHGMSIVTGYRDDERQWAASAALTFGEALNRRG